MRRLVIHWLSAFLAVLLAASILPIFATPPTWEQAAVFAAILALLNAFVRPIISLVTCPINILTLGLFTLIINTFTFWLAAFLYRELGVPDFFSAFLGALLVSVVSFVVDRLLEDG
ncbi:MAG: phage holin family protein [Chloroflexi bacterium]|nr:phage holin family protein [Chloroflexota bacterium]